MVYATISIWYGFIYGWLEYIHRVGVFSVSALGASVLLAVFAFAYSTNILKPALVDDQLSRNGSHLTVGTFNKLYSSDNFSNDAALITAAQLDVFSIQEASEDDIRFIKEQVGHEYTYVTDCDCSANDTEVGLVSRFPIINAQTIYEHPGSVIARTVLESETYGQFVVYIVHMHVPYTSGSYALREGVYDLLSEAIVDESLPVFAVGDFNTTIYSPDMQAFMKNTPNVRNIVLSPWPACSWFGYGELACARIDFVFAPRNATPFALEIGNESASDHRSVIAEILLEAQQPASHANVLQ